MKIVAFLQNQWFKEPERIRRTYKVAEEMCDPNSNPRERPDARFLFMGCLTGRRLQTAFGAELCDQIIWANASPQIAGKSDGVFPADIPHMLGVLEKHAPQIVLGFGSIAVPPLRRMKDAGAPWELIAGPHPAARHNTVTQELRAMAERVRELMMPQCLADASGRGK